MKRQRTYNYKSITYEQTHDPLIREAFLEAFINRTIDAGYLSKNKRIKTNCMTLRPRRGGEKRYFIDRYIEMAVKDPYNNRSYLYCKSHRAVAFLFNGDLPPGKQALHKCDIKMCCNPDHIYIGTEKDNRNDYRNRRTEKRLNGNLTRGEWESILYWKRVGEHTNEEIAAAFNCHISTVKNPPAFTTDGSEVIGEVFAPTIIPEAVKVRRIKSAIKIGEYCSNLISECKKNGTPLCREVLAEASKELGLTTSYIYRLMRLSREDLHRANFKYGISELMRMVDAGIDVSVPV